MTAPVRFIMASLWSKRMRLTQGHRFVLSGKGIAPAGRSRWGALVLYGVRAGLPAQFHGLALSHVRKKRNLASAIDLHTELALMLRTKTRRSFGKNLSQTIHELLQFLGPLVIERELLLTDSAFSLPTMEHNLERNLLRHAFFRIRIRGRRSSLAGGLA